jgi:hypothetical protein
VGVAGETDVKPVFGESNPVGFWNVETRVIVKSPRISNPIIGLTALIKRFIFTSINLENL